MRFGVFASSAFALPLLARLLAADDEVVQILTSPARPAGRGMRMRQPPPALFAETHGIALAQPESLRGAEGEKQAAHMRHLDLDLVITAAYGKIIPQAMLDAPRLGCVNLHASLLPRWRGADPIRHAILAGDQQTGISLMQMEAGLDCGPVYASQACVIGDLTHDALEEKLSIMAADLLMNHVPDLAAGRLTATPQDEAQATLAEKIPPDQWRIDWHKPASVLARLVQAGAPKPGAWCLWGSNPSNRLAVLAARAEETPASGAVGTMLDNQGAIQCGAGSLRLLHVRPAGGRAMMMAELMRGRRLGVGDRLQ